MELQEYIKLHYKPRKRKTTVVYKNSLRKADADFDIDKFCMCDCVCAPIAPKPAKRPSMPKVEKTFMEQVFALIDEKGLTDVETYKRANVDRRAFSKMRSDMQYRPSRDTAFKFCFALELDLARAKQLLSAAGFAISHSNMRDIVFEYCLVEKIYDLMKVNDKLYEENVTPELE